MFNKDLSNGVLLYRNAKLSGLCTLSPRLSGLRTAALAVAVLFKVLISVIGLRGLWLNIAPPHTLFFDGELVACLTTKIPPLAASALQ